MVTEYFKKLEDPRQAGKVRHNLLEIIVMTICAVIADCDVWEDIADYCHVKEQWFREALHLELKEGIPSHDTLQRVWSMLDPKVFEKCFGEWVSSVCHPQERECVSIDGKTLCGSRSEERKPLHMVSAWAHKNQIVLGQIATDEKSNEITAVPALLDALDVAGAIVTTDAMSCQKEIARKVTARGADYVFALKENQPNLSRDIRDYFQAVDEFPAQYLSPAVIVTAEKQHGRIEKRQYTLTTDCLWLENREEWSQLHGIGRVRSEVTVGDTVRTDERYYITSLTDVKEFGTAVRAHWGIENSLHWCLDMTFHEDHSRMRKDHSAENMAVVRHLALNLLKLNPSKMSIARKRRHCSYDEDFLAEIVLSVHA